MSTGPAMNAERVDPEPAGAEPVETERMSPAPASRPRHTASPVPVQPKLMVGAADDGAEREADRVARTVVASLRRGGADDPAGSDDIVARPSTRIRRASTIGAAGGEVDQDFESRVRSARGGGAALPTEVGHQMQGAFGADFSGVRLHTDSQSHALNSRIQARAFTTGSEIFLGGTAPSLATAAGKELLAHELTHLVQQDAHAQRSIIRRDYLRGSAAKDADLFDKEAPVDKPLDVSAGSRAAKFGITAGNMKHYLERHTFKYQRLNAKTVSPGAGFFPHTTNGHTTTADDVKAMLDEALAKLPDSATIGTTPVSVPVDLSNGLRVNVGALKGGKLSAFFPIAGGTNPGFHEYSSDELKAIRTVKNAPAAGGGTP